MAEDQIFFLRLNVKRSEIKFENKIFYRYFIGNPVQLTKNKFKIQELKKSIETSINILDQDVKMNRFDFLSAQYFSLILNGSKKYLIGNLLFLFRISRAIIVKFGYRKMLLLILYPVRRIL